MSGACGARPSFLLESRCVSKVLIKHWRNVNHQMINGLIICLRCNAQTRNSLKSMIDWDLVSKLIISALTPLARLLSTVCRCRRTWRLQDIGRETHRPLGR
jgi:hypothetical protein